MNKVSLYEQGYYSVVNLTMLIGEFFCELVIDDIRIEAVIENSCSKKE